MGVSNGHFRRRPATMGTVTWMTIPETAEASVSVLGDLSYASDSCLEARQALTVARLDLVIAARRLASYRLGRHHNRLHGLADAVSTVIRGVDAELAQLALDLAREQP